MTGQVEDLEYGVETVFIVYLHLLTKLPVPQVLFSYFTASINCQGIF